MFKKKKENKNISKQNIIIKRNVLNIVLLGDSPTGKTSIIKTYLKVDTIDPNNNYFLHSIKLSNGKEYKLKIYDTPGQERYRSFCLSILKNVQGAILVYTVNEKRTFYNIQNRLKEIIDINKDIIFI